MAIADSSTAVRLRQRLADLKRAAIARHALQRGTAEYDAAIEEEVRLANEVRRLADEERRRDS